MIAIAAVDENFGIGYKGDLLVRIPEDVNNPLLKSRACKSPY